MNIAVRNGGDRHSGSQGNRRCSFGERREEKSCHDTISGSACQNSRRFRKNIFLFEPTFQ